MNIEWYTIGLSYENLSRSEAITLARKLGFESETMVWVYGHKEYDDSRPVTGQTGFWRDCGFSIYKTSWDGR